MAFSTGLFTLTVSTYFSFLFIYFLLSSHFLSSHASLVFFSKAKTGFTQDSHGHSFAPHNIHRCYNRGLSLHKTDTCGGFNQTSKSQKKDSQITTDNSTHGAAKSQTNNMFVVAALGALRLCLPTQRAPSPSSAIGKSTAMASLANPGCAVPPVQSVGWPQPYTPRPHPYTGIPPPPASSSQSGSRTGEREI
jgi:hypothetical protein